MPIALAVTLLLAILLAPILLIRFRKRWVDEARRRVADCRRAALSRGDEFGKVVFRLVEVRFADCKAEP